MGNVCRQLNLNLSPKELVLDDAIDAPHNMQTHVTEGVVYYTTRVKLVRTRLLRNRGVNLFRCFRRCMMV